MKCPNPSCRTEDQFESIFAQLTGRNLPARFNVYSIIRRMRKCKRCNFKFYSIELTEKDFLFLIDKATLKEIERKTAAYKREESI